MGRRKGRRCSTSVRGALMVGCSSHRGIPSILIIVDGTSHWTNHNRTFGRYFGDWGWTRKQIFGRQGFVQRRRLWARNECGDGDGLSSWIPWQSSTSGWTSDVNWIWCRCRSSRWDLLGRQILHLNGSRNEDSSRGWCLFDWWRSLFPCSGCLTIRSSVIFCCSWCRCWRWFWLWCTGRLFGLDGGFGLRWSFCWNFLSCRFSGCWG